MCPTARDRDDRSSDPSLVRNQPALRTSNGGVWLVWGAVSAVIVGAVMASLIALEPTVGWSGLIAVVVLALGMVAARFLIRPQRPRLIMLAVLQSVMVLVGLVLALVVVVGVLR